jgi:pimeloyl-ACP methyl ester carboxylesterase
VTAQPLAYTYGGSPAGPLLVLLHGLGANRRVFDGLIEAAADTWPGDWLAPDLAGHGASRWSAPYTFDSHADDVAALLTPGRPCVILGHSMGGVVAIELANARYDLDVQAVIGLGIKVTWTPEELARAATMGDRSSQQFFSRDEAVARFLKVSGLGGLVPEDTPVVASAIQETQDGWTIAFDPAGFAVGDPELVRRVDEAKAPVRLARGQNDAMVSLGELRALDPGAVDLPGLGHNAHVESPQAVLDLIIRSL